MSTPQWIWSRKCSFPSDMKIAHELTQEVLDVLRRESWTQHDLFGVEMALEESLANAVHHGNVDDPSKSVHFECCISDSLIRIQVEDEGSGFDYKSLQDPRTPENVEKITGRGVFLIYGFMPKVEYDNHGKRVTMEKSRNLS